MKKIKLGTNFIFYLLFFWSFYVRGISKFQLDKSILWLAIGIGFLGADNFNKKTNKYNHLLIMEIKNCLLSDVEEVLFLYEAARNLQREGKMVVWPFFENTFLENEILESRQWMLIIDNVIACNWAKTFEDKEIREAKDRDDSIFIHRIATNPIFRGNRYIDRIVEWSKLYALQMGKQYVRLDTLGSNTKLIEHYTSAGFQFLGMFELTNTSSLPSHYQNEPNCCLFEIDLYAIKSNSSG